MATYTREQLVKSVLTELCEVDVNEAPEAKDFEIVNDRCQSVMEELYEDGFIPFDVDTDQIPARYYTALTFIIAVTLINTYSAQDRGADLRQNAALGQRTLNKLVQQGNLPTVAQADYF